MAQQDRAGDSGLTIKNGSGLRCQPHERHERRALLTGHVARCAVQPEFLAQLAVGGVDGTLHKRFRATRHHGAIRAKTGTCKMRLPSRLCARPPGKSPAAFSILFNQVSGKADVRAPPPTNSSKSSCAASGRLALAQSVPHMLADFAESLFLKLANALARQVVLVPISLSVSSSSSSRPKRQRMMRDSMG